MKSELDVIRAETMMVDLAVELNLPFSSLDSLSKAVKKMFPDSKIAKDFHCGRSKGTAILRENAAKKKKLKKKKDKQSVFFSP